MKVRNAAPPYGVRNRIGQLAGFVLNPALDHLVLVFAGRGHLGLLADRRPHTGQDGKAMDCHLILKD